MRTGITDLHRTGMCAQQQRFAPGIIALDIESVLHGTGRVVFRAVQGSEIGPVRFDLRPVSNIKTDGTET